MKIIGVILLGMAVVGTTLWGVGVLYYSPLLPLAWRPFGAGGYALLTVLAFLILPRRGRTAIGALAVLGVLVILFLRIPASNDREWQPLLHSINMFFRACGMDSCLAPIAGRFKWIILCKT